jgi:hypothetical protein
MKQLLLGRGVSTCFKQVNEGDILNFYGICLCYLLIYKKGVM